MYAGTVEANNQGSPTPGRGGGHYCGTQDGAAILEGELAGRIDAGDRDIERDELPDRGGIRPNDGEGGTGDALGIDRQADGGRGAGGVAGVAAITCGQAMCAGTGKGDA